MKIVVLTGSHHLKGMSALLAEKFIAGAADAGHEIVRIDSAYKNVHGCLGCLKCNAGENPCVWKDDMTEIGRLIMESDAVVFAFPLYYHLMPMPLKGVLDRFYAWDKMFVGAHKKVFMLVTGWEDSEANFAPMRVWLQSDMDYLKWDIVGELTIGGFMTREELDKSEVPQRAYEMGKNIEV